jgi:adenosylcobinamide-GDP ribazoletransferase
VLPGYLRGSSKVRALLAFFTALPVSDRGASLEDAARRAYLLPLVGLLTGFFGASFLLLATAIPPGVAATLGLGAALLAAGLHHTDGVMDIGDALMVRGSPERRREVLKDSRVGVGAVGALFVVYGPAIAALAALAEISPPVAAVALLTGEVVARSTMLLLLLFGKPADTNSSSVYFVRSLKGTSRRYVALVLALLVPSLVALPLGWPTVLVGLAATVVTAIFALALGKGAFRGISGDASGAAGEMARTVLLVSLSGLLL